ncbi:MAG: hypothetical protein WBF55_01540 [Syntrophobacteria bacterium]|jgi:hypothetical protein
MKYGPSEILTRRITTVKGEMSTGHERRSLYHPLKKKSLTIGEEDMIFVSTAVLRF